MPTSKCDMCKYRKGCWKTCKLKEEAKKRKKRRWWSRWQSYRNARFAVGKQKL